MKVQLEGFRNLVGQHCSSSALRSVLAYDGLELPEAITFGLGSGLGFFYSIEPKASPTRRFNGRAPDLEGNFYKLLGQPITWPEHWQSELINQALKQGRPVLAQTDIFPIPYYDNAHFIGHGLVIVGLVGEELLVADIAADDFSSMSLSDFRKAVEQDHYPLLAPYHYAPAPKVEAVNFKELAPLAIAKTAAYMLMPPTDYEGVSGICLLAEDLPNWLELPDLPWSVRFGYQGIEKRGSGGGNFRSLYRDFLAEVLPQNPASYEILSGFEQSAQLWTSLAQELKQLAFATSGKEQRIGLEQAKAVTLRIAGLEQQLFETLGKKIALKKG